MLNVIPSMMKSCPFHVYHGSLIQISGGFISKVCACACLGWQGDLSLAKKSSESYTCHLSTWAKLLVRSSLRRRSWTLSSMPRYNAHTKPTRSPLDAHTMPIVKYGHSGNQELGLHIKALVVCRSISFYMVFYSGHCVGIEWASSGHRVGIVWASSGPSKNIHACMSIP